MKLYLVRHGETNSNLQNRVVRFDDPLTDNGRSQAEKVARRVSDLSIDLIITSPHKRTKETARIIGGIMGKDVQEITLLEEKKWPSEIEGKPIDDPKVKKIFALIREKSDIDPDWHYSNEENFLDIKKRAKLFVEYISGLNEENVLAVSHEYFIKIVIATMIFNDQLTYGMFRSFFHSTSLSNASLTLCEKEQAAWKLAKLND